MATLPVPSEVSVCDRLLAKLDELMDFLAYAPVHPKQFFGVVTFSFRASNENSLIACVRTVDMRNGLKVSSIPFNSCDPYAEQVVTVLVSLADFLYMYSGEASAAEIASMCMSGRVQVGWSSFGKLRAFAESFDFTTEKWEEYYSVREVHGYSNDPPKCSKPCCSTNEAIDANWLLVSEATLTPALGGDWEVVSDCMCEIIPEENREKMKEVLQEPGMKDWLSNIFNKQSVASVSKNVKKSVSDLRDMAEKFFEGLDEI